MIREVLTVNVKLIEKVFPRLSLTHFMSLVLLYIPYKHQKTSDFYVFRGLQKETSSMKWIKYIS